MENISFYKPVAWDTIPDIGLYMDQVVTFISRVFEPLNGNDTSGFISPSMINNYVKAKLIPKPAGKKYTREQIALLLLIVILKQVATMEEIRILLTVPEDGSVQMLYERFISRQNTVLDRMRQTTPEDDFSTPMDYAILSASYRALFGQMLKN